MTELNGYSDDLPRVVMFSGISTEHLHSFTLVSSSTSFSLGLCFPFVARYISFCCVKVKLEGGGLPFEVKCLSYSSFLHELKLPITFLVHIPYMWGGFHWIFYDFLYVHLLGKSYLTSVSETPSFQIFNILINLDLYICYCIYDSFQWNHIFLIFQQTSFFCFNRAVSDSHQYGCK